MAAKKKTARPRPKKASKDVPVVDTMLGEGEVVDARVRTDRKSGIRTKDDAPDPTTREVLEDLVTCAFEVKVIDVANRTAEFVASTGVVDAHDEVVDQATWQLGDYLKNPVVLFAHQSRELPIGKSLFTGLVGGRLECKIEFATEDMNPKAEQVWKMVQAKFLRAVSVGFLPRTYRWEMRDGVEVWVWADCILKEISVTPVPANPEALAKAKQLAPRASTEAQAREGQEKTIMKTLEQVTAELAKATAEKELTEKQLDDAKKSAESLQAALTASEGTVKALTADRDSWKERAEKAEDAAIGAEVDALVGVKILPAEKDTFVELRKSNPKLFTKMVGDRPELKMLGGQVVTDAKKDASNPVVKADGGKGEDLAAIFDKS